MKFTGILAAGLITVSAVPAAASAPELCGGRFRYAASTNTIYLSMGVGTLTEIAAACPKAPLRRLDKSTWRLDADLVVERGATLVLQGAARGGDVDTLLLRSAASARKTEVSAITARYGTILIEGVKITSWDPATGGPDTDPRVPKGAPPDARGRAFIRAISYMEGGTPRESRMDIIDSDLGHLGYYAPESYGVSYKARGCDAANLRVCDALNVYGKQIGSRFHHNYFGTYTYNAYGMDFIGNEYDHNVSYGLDPHDDSDHLIITGNAFHHNGNHGLICSQRCDHLTITKNVSRANGVPGQAPEGGEERTGDLVTGIMLHRGVTDSLVADNVIEDHPTGSGIAVFDSVGNVIRNNKIVNARYGLRYSVGTRDTKTLGNVVVGSGRNAVFTYRGKDKAGYTGTSGRPANLLFSGNTFDGAGAEIVSLHDSDGVRFTGNTFTGRTGPVRMQNSTNTVFVGNTAPPSLTYLNLGASAVFQNNTGPVRTAVDAGGSVTFTTADGAVYAGSAATTLTPSGSSVTLRSRQLGTSPVTVTNAQVKAVPTAGSALVRVTRTDSSVRLEVVGRPGVPVDYVVEGLRPGKVYAVTLGGTTITTATASATGKVRFRAAPPTGTAVVYRVAELPM